MIFTVQNLLITDLSIPFATLHFHQEFLTLRTSALKAEKEAGDACKHLDQKFNISMMRVSLLVITSNDKEEADISKFTVDISDGVFSHPKRCQKCFAVIEFIRFTCEKTAMQMLERSLER